MPEKKKTNENPSPQPEKAAEPKPKKQPKGTLEVRLKTAASARITLGNEVYDLKSGEPAYVDARHRKALQNYLSILEIAD